MLLPDEQLEEKYSRNTSSLQRTLSHLHINIHSFVVVGEGEFRVLSDTRTLEVEEIRNQTAGQSDKGQQRTRPAVVQGMVHLLGEQHDAGTPETPDACLGRQCAGGLVLVCVDEIVVRRVVQENEAEANGETTCILLSAQKSPVFWAPKNSVRFLRST